VQVVVPELEHETSAPVASTPPVQAPDRVAPALPAASSSSAGTTQRILGWSAIGAGAIGLGVGIAFEVIRGNKVSERDAICSDPTQPCTEADKIRNDQLTSDAKGAATIGIVGLVGGGLLAAGGLVLVFTAPHGESVAATPVVVPGFVGAAFTARTF